LSLAVIYRKPHREISVMCQ